MKTVLKNKGFTLLELMVALAVFTIVSIIVVSVFSVSAKNQRQAFLMQNLQDNARFIIDRFSKETRMGIIQDRPDDDTNLSVYFENQEGDNVRYKFETIDGANYLTRLEKKGGTIGVGEQGEPLSSLEIDITGMFYTVNQAGKQQRVTMGLLLKPKGSSEPALRVQGTVTSRQY